MDEKFQEDQGSTSVFSRYRSPSFHKAEVKMLIQLIEKYKNAIVNKSTNASANHAKEQAWDKVTKEFNRQGLGYERTTDVLKTKWVNLKKSARKLNKDVMDGDCEFDKDDICLYKTVAMICTEGVQSGDFDLDRDGDDFAHDNEYNKPWECEDVNDSAIYSHDNEIPKTPIKIELPPLSFSPKECQLLLQCVRQEKNILFSKSSVIKRHRAWKRIAQIYNKDSPTKRTAKELNKKFSSMKAMARKINMKGYFKDIKRKKYDQLDEIMEQKVKSEPIIDCVDEHDFDSDDDKELKSPDNSNLAANAVRLSFTDDPLSNVQSSDSGLGSISDNKDCARLNSELLRYKMETARLQRKRLEAQIKSDEREQEARALEHSLRLRAARLEVIAAASKLPPSHPALKFTFEERRAQEYLNNPQLDIG